MTDTTTYPLSVLVSAILGSEATSPMRLAGDMVDALQVNGYLTGADSVDAWAAVHERIRTIYGRVSDRELADEALEVLRDRNLVLDPAA
jgi:hypothetical protein